VHLYQQANETSALSSLSPWITVMLSRDLEDGSANFAGVAGDAVTYLGNGFVDLHPYGPRVQRILGAAAYCEISGDVGGEWPDILWPPLNHTSNVVFGPVVNDQPRISTVLLNYGPSWQYNPVSENSLPGGSVSYIANNTGPDVSFPILFTSYIRNQWTLMAYSIPHQSGNCLSHTFIGSGPNQLYISVTGVIALPLVALGLGLLLTIYAWISTVRHRRWVNRVEFEPWWLVKALCPELYKAGYGNATMKDLKEACSGHMLSYRDIRPDCLELGYLRLCPALADEGESIGVGSVNDFSERPFA